MKYTVSEIEEKQTEKKCEKKKIQNFFSSVINDGLSNLFYRIGFTVASNPWTTILLSMLCVIACSCGLSKLRLEKDPLKIWTPEKTKFYRDTQWLTKNFENGYREQTILLTADNVLHPNVLKKIGIIRKSIINIGVKDQLGSRVQWKNICFKVPSIINFIDDDDLDYDRTESSEEETDIETDESVTIASTSTNQTTTTKRPYNPSVDLSSTIFCPILNIIPKICYEKNMIELWQNDMQTIANLTLKDVLLKLNIQKRSPVTGLPLDVKEQLGGIKRNNKGDIISASSILLHYYIAINYTDTNVEVGGNLVATEQWVTPNILLWERRLVQVLEKIRPTVETGSIKLFYNTANSFGDISFNGMFQELSKLQFGGLIMLAYMIICLSKINWVEIRLVFSCLGIFCVILSFLVSVGLTSFMGIKISTPHGTLPFILLGINTDDIFVLMANFRLLKNYGISGTLPERVGLALKNSAVSITVTTLTNVVSFAIGVNSDLPSLNIFCINAVLGVVAMYLLVITFITAVLTLDERRIEARKNAFIPCIQHKAPESEKTITSESTPVKENSYIEFFYSKIALTTPGKIVIILILLTITGVAIDGFLHLTKKNDPNWVLPSDSYLVKFCEIQKKYYPDVGNDAYVYTGKLNYTKSMPNLIKLAHTYENQTDILHSFNAWVLPFQEFIKINYDEELLNITESKWKLYLSKFLFTEQGGKYQENIFFTKKLKCGKPVSDIKMASFKFTLKRFDNESEYNPAKNRLTQIMDQTNFTNSGDGFSTVWSKVFMYWYADEVIDKILIQNVVMALIGVMICVAVLIPNFRCFLIILMAVVLTTFNIIGFLDKWDLSINGIVVFSLQFAIGLCVDFASHIVHCFMVTPDGTRTDRTIESLKKIGGAVFYAGTTTLIGISMMGISKNYAAVFLFKTMVLLVVFGLINGLLFVPLLLCTFGPKPYASAVKSVDQTRL